MKSHTHKTAVITPNAGSIGTTYIAARTMESLPDGWALTCLSSLDDINDTNGAEMGVYKHAPQSGIGVDVYVMDTGIYEIYHSFGARVKYLPFPGVNQKAIRDHGTQVASLIGSRDFGSAKQVTLWSCNIRTTARLRDALGYIIWHNNGRRTEQDYKGAVLNLSLAFTIDEQIGAHLKKIEQQGIAIIIAAGNEGHDMVQARIFSGLSAYSDYAIVVGAIDKFYARARYDSIDRSQRGTNYGKRITLFAPGKDLTGLNKKGKAVDRLEGTSFACAYVSGIVATFYSECEHMSPKTARLLLLHNARHNVLRGLDENSPNILANNGYLKAQQQQAAISRKENRTAEKHGLRYNKKSHAKKTLPFLQLPDSD